MDISNLSREQKIQKILEDHSHKKTMTISSTLFPKEKLPDEEMLKILNQIIDEIGFIANAPNVIFNETSHNSKTIVGATIDELIKFVKESLDKDESIGIYQIGYDNIINKYSIRCFFYPDIGRKVRRIRETKIDLILNDKPNIQ